MILKINGIDLPKMPLTFEPSIMDLDDGESTRRTADGTLRRDRVAVKRKLNMTWSILTWQELSLILKLVQDPEFSVMYPDPMTGDYQTKRFYVGDRSSPVALFRGGEPIWNGLSMNFVEV